MTITRAQRPPPTRHAVARWAGATSAAVMTAAILLGPGGQVSAAIVPTVGLGSAATFAVLASSTVTNTGNSTLDNSMGLWPGTSITGFPPGQVLAPGTIETTSPAAQQAQADLTAAYVDAAGRPVDATTTADLANLVLIGGVYAGPSKSALSLSGPLVLDGAGDMSSVFIFQTDSTLITGSGSSVTLINGAQECNVFWQVGSSATLGSGSVFAGNILALTSITVDSSVVVHGRALARNGAVTLDNDTFTKPTCAQPTTTTTTTTTTATAAADTTTTVAGGVTTLAGASATTAPGGANIATTVPTTLRISATTSPGGTLPRTGPATTTGTALLAGVAALALGAIATGMARRRAPLQR